MARAVRLAALFLLVTYMPTLNASGDARIKQLVWLDRADVKADFRHHVVEQHGTRFIAVYGYATDIPGVPEHLQHPLVEQHRVRYIEGTSDNITSPEYDRLVGKAERYARRYNEMLVDYLRGHPNA
jgi:hypothetical protein